ncbi:hypothetical protein GY12_05820 [Micrococcus luteus]|nr:hypothetical protein GY12_05820 [Micrococcus luteus]
MCGREERKYSVSTTTTTTEKTAFSTVWPKPRSPPNRSVTATPSAARRSVWARTASWRWNSSSSCTNHSAVITPSMMAGRSWTSWVDCSITVGTRRATNAPATAARPSAAASTPTQRGRAPGLDPAHQRVQAQGDEQGRGDPYDQLPVRAQHRDDADGQGHTDREQEAGQHGGLDGHGRDRRILGAVGGDRLGVHSVLLQERAAPPQDGAQAEQSTTPGRRRPVRRRRGGHLDRLVGDAGHGRPLGALGFGRGTDVVDVGGIRAGRGLLLLHAFSVRQGPGLTALCPGGYRGAQ